MKYKLLALTAIFATGTAQAALINATNINTGSGDTVVTDNTGAPILGVYTAITTFGGNSAPTDIAGLISSSFTALALNDLFNTGGSGNEGVFSNAYSGAGGGGESIYLVFANNPDLGLATVFGLIDTGETLDADGASPDSNNYILANGNGTALIGAFNATTVTADWAAATGGNNTGPQFQLAVAVPEPSTSLLAGFAGLMLLIRRKR